MIKGLKIYVYILSMQDLIIKLFLKQASDKLSHRAFHVILYAGM